MPLHPYIVLPVLSLSLFASSCNKSDSKSTPLQLTLNQPQQEVEPVSLELESLVGEHDQGELFIRYQGAGDELKKWTIQAPFKINVSQEYIEIHFSGSYYIDNQPTKPGNKRLFIKKQDINMIFLSE